MIHFMKIQGKFKPLSNSDNDRWNKIKENQIYCMRAKRDRNYMHHKKLFAIARLIIDTLPDGHVWENKQPYQLIKASEIPLGFVEEIIHLDGEVTLVPESINFEMWSQDKFEEFYNKVIKFWAEKFGYSVEDLENNHGEYL